MSLREKLIFEKNFPHKHFTTSKSCGDMKNVSERNALLHLLGIDESSLVLAKQVHGTRVRAVTSADKGTFIDDCDGLVTADKNITLGVFTADCMPVLMFSEDGSVKAAVHAGRKGLACGILQETLNVFKEKFNISPQKINAYIGPHIRRCCYEVGPGIGEMFGDAFAGGKLDLSAAAENILEKKGLKKLFISGFCSCCKSGNFFSYRKDKTEKRMLTAAF